MYIPTDFKNCESRFFVHKRLAMRRAEERKKQQNKETIAAATHEQTGFLGQGRSGSREGLDLWRIWIYGGSGSMEGLDPGRV